MSIIEGMLAVADDQAVSDWLLGQLPKSAWSRYASISMQMEPSDKTALEQAREGGAIKATAIATRSTSPELLAVMAKDKRRGVRRAIVSNSHANDATTKLILRDAIKQDDYETIDYAARSMSPAAMLDVLEEMVPGDRVLSNFNVAINNIDDAAVARRFLVCQYPVLAQLVVKKVSSEAIGDLEIDEALALATIDDAMKASALVESKGTLSEDHARIVASAYQTGWRPNRVACSCTPEASEVLAAVPDNSLRTVALEHPLTDSMLESICTKVTDLIVAHAALRCTNDAQAHKLAELVIKMRTTDRIDRAGSSQNRYYSTSRMGDDAQENLLNQGRLSPEAAAKLIASGHLDATLPWIARGAGTRPTEEVLAALFADMGTAFVPSWQLTAPDSGPDWYEVRKHISHLSEAEWLPALIERVPGVMQVLGSNSSKATLGYVYGRLQAAMGDDTVLWNQLVSLAGSFPGTISELLQVASVSCGRELLGPARAPAQEWTGRLFEDA